MYRCYKCDFEFDFPLEWEEDRGEFWGTHCTETMCGCPQCKGDFGAIKKCVVCNNNYYEDEMMNSVCEECQEKKITYELALEFLKYKGWLADFFLCYYYDISNDNNFRRSEALDKEFCKIYDFKQQEDVVCGKSNFYRDVKEYIVDNMFDWTEFLEKEENHNENAKG